MALLYGGVSNSELVCMQLYEVETAVSVLIRENECSLIKERSIRTVGLYVYMYSLATHADDIMQIPSQSQSI